jgi:two-component system response regulator WspF
MRIAIANDMIMTTETLRRIVASVPDYQVVWTARDGAEAVTKCVADTPDLLLMDLIMPVMDGVQATQQIMKQSPCAIVIVTSNVEKNAAKVFEALGDGALDAVSTPVLGPKGDTSAAQPLLQKIANIRKLLGKSSQITSARSPQNSPLSISSLLVIGASTGGPKALAKVLSGLPANFQSAVVIVQHVDAQFSQGMVDWLQLHTQLPVVLASSGDRLQGGTIYLAGTNDHLVLQKDLSLGYVREPIDYPYRPSVDVFFRSVAQNWQRPGTAVLLTGMGKDGAEGLLELRQKGWQTIAQNEATCVVYGMPKAAVQLGAATEVLPLEAIVGAVLQTVRR